MTTLRKRRDKLCLVPQNLIEYWAVATRPAEANGLDLRPDETAHEVRKFKTYFHFFNDGPDIFQEWERLVLKHQVIGKNVHDARLVAAMLEHGITHLLTFNGKDFKRFNEITVLDPYQV